MGIFDRIRNSLRSSLDGIASGVEQNNVAAVYESAIDNAMARVVEYTDRLSGLVVMRNRLSDEVQELEGELRRVLPAIEGAVAEDDDETAVVLIARKDELQQKLTDHTTELEALTTQVEEAKANLSELRRGIAELKREKDQAVVDKTLASAQIDAQEAASGLAVDGTAKGLSSVRESIGRLERQAHPGYLDEEGNSVRGRAEAMGRKAKEASARAQLEALKKARAERASGSSDEDDVDGEGSGSGGSGRTL